MPGIFGLVFLYLQINEHNQAKLTNYEILGLASGEDDESC
jgi:hypothetical protein